MRIVLASPEAKVWSERKHIPLGRGYLAAVLRDAGHDVLIYDAAIEDDPIEQVIEQAADAGKPMAAARATRLRLSVCPRRLVPRTMIARG